MSTLKKLLEDYSSFERDICNMSKALFSGICGMCTACCCRADICEEAAESAFLSLLLEKQGLSEKDMDERYGWLELHGCSLEYGRPPVCYAFYCSDLLSSLPDGEMRFSAEVLGKLLHHTGQHALGHRHLVEIMNRSDLDKIDLDSVFQRMEESRSAFSVIAEHLQSGRLTQAERDILSVITTEEP